MKFLVLALCVCAAAAAPQQRVYKPWTAAAQAVAAPAPVVPVVKASHSGSDVDAPILRSEYDVRPEGSYNYAYETGNGIAAEATGTVKKVNDLDVINVVGSYQYTAADGTPVQLSYIADENGYQPKSDLLPVGPAIPEAIRRSLEWIATHPAHVERVEAVKKF